MGWGFRHEYQRELRPIPDGFEYTDQEGQVVEFPEIEPGTSVAKDGLRLHHRGGNLYAIEETDQPTMEFELLDGGSSSPLKALEVRPLLDRA